jgi:pilus assembly protein CpaE
LAFALARQHPGKVLLAEMGPGVPEIALDLDLAPQHSPADLAREWQFVDPTFVRQAVTRHADGVDILAYPAGTPIAAALDPVAMRHLCVLFSNIYEVTVLDMGNTLNSSIPAILPFADPVVVVTRPEVPSLRLGRALLQQLGQLNVPSSRIWPIVNRDRQRRQVSWREAEQALALPVTAWIPDDPGALNHAHNLGQPITNAASRSIVTRSFNDLARVLHARPLA